MKVNKIGLINEGTGAKVMFPGKRLPVRVIGGKSSALKKVFSIKKPPQN